jgi:hypothetical protein
MIKNVIRKALQHLKKPPRQKPGALNRKPLKYCHSQIFAAKYISIIPTSQEESMMSSS